MTISSFNPTYYRVIWSGVSPSNYNGLTNDKNGGIDPKTSWQIKNSVMITGTVLISSTPFAQDAYIIINNQQINFLSTDTLSNIINKINSWSSTTNVVASQNVTSGYLTLENSVGTESSPISISEGSANALSALGLVAGVYKNPTIALGSAYSNVTVGSTAVINFTNITFSSSSISNVINTINQVSSKTGIVASLAGPNIQLSSPSDSPALIGAGNAVTSLGFVTNTAYTGYPRTLDDSLAKERANMRWNQVINELQKNMTTIFVGDFDRINPSLSQSVNTLSFTVGIDKPENVITISASNEPNPGVLLQDTDAVKRLVARAVTVDITSTRKIYDPTPSIGNTYVRLDNSAQIKTITAAALDTVSNISIIENNITVTKIY